MMRSMFYGLITLLVVSACGSDDDTTPAPALPAITVQDFSVEEGDEDRQVIIDFRLTKATDTQVVAEVQTIDGTAKRGEDFLNPQQATLTFAPGGLIASLNLTIIGDDVAEPDEELTIRVTNATGATFQNAEMKLTIENDDIDTNFEIPSSGYSTPDSYDGMVLIWQDEFDQSTLNSANWTNEIGNGSDGWGNNELQFYREDNSYIKEGNLVIEARDETFNGFKYTSARIITQNKFDFQYGRVDVRAALPYGQGLWPAIWMLGANFSEVGWPKCGEIDIMEMVGGTGKDNVVHGTAHWSQNDAHVFHTDEYEVTSGNLQNEFHVYSVVWDDTFIRWYIDDVLYNTLNISDEQLSELQGNFFLIMNVAVGGNWPGDPDGETVFPQRMIVDYARVFQPE